MQKYSLEEKLNKVKEMIRILDEQKKIWNELEVGTVKENGYTDMKFSHLISALEIHKNNLEFDIVDFP